MENTDKKDALSDGAAANGTANDQPPPRRRKTVEELAIEQGAPLIADFDAMLGEGKDLWDSDEDFEEWMKNLNESRRRG
jgi:uncharacterized protein (DUF2384 family)